jgi:hypothetical protein
MYEIQSWFAGVDWASQKHDVWLADANGSARQQLYKKIERMAAVSSIAEAPD